MSSNPLTQFHAMHPSVLKSSGSAFENFVQDEFTTLVEVSDRIFSTSVDLEYTYTPISLGPHSELVSKLAELGKEKEQAYNDVAKRAREVTLEVFTTDASASIQATLFKMAGILVKEHAQLAKAGYALPNFQ